VAAVEEMAVHDRVEAEILGDVRGAPGVPAEAMAVFGFHGCPITGGDTRMIAGAPAARSRVVAAPEYNPGLEARG